MNLLGSDQSWPWLVFLVVIACFVLAVRYFSGSIQVREPPAAANEHDVELAASRSVGAEEGAAGKGRPTQPGLAPAHWGGGLATDASAVSAMLNFRAAVAAPEAKRNLSTSSKKSVQFRREPSFLEFNPESPCKGSGKNASEAPKSLPGLSRKSAQSTEGAAPTSSLRASSISTPAGISMPPAMSSTGPTQSSVVEENREAVTSETLPPKETPSLATAAAPKVTTPAGLNMSPAISSTGPPPSPEKGKDGTPVASETSPTKKASSLAATATPKLTTPEAESIPESPNVDLDRGATIKADTLEEEVALWIERVGGRP
eukprot:TRINITY_DN15191_c0_g1_i1.p2 TRINITY_DN15191_c0_g1~~TRINITY_DN15191_c0_g1_i1.p2  ORF type:complete len:316 (-),score=59.63 TRINITY_DN15191_c0_g1_i1:1130-2077(-)